MKSNNDENKIFNKLKRSRPEIFQSLCSPSGGRVLAVLPVQVTHCASTDYSAGTVEAVYRTAASTRPPLGEHRL